MAKRISSNAEEQQNWDEIVMQNAVREENKIKELCSHFSFYNSPYNNAPSKDDTVDISMSFFDQINGL